MLSRARALAGLRELASRTTNGVSSSDVRARHSNALYQALLHHFGSIEAARDAAGVPAPAFSQQRWSEQAVIEQLQTAHRAGVELTVSGLAAAGLRGLANAAHEYCGGLRRARRLARVPGPAPKIIELVRWDEDTVISEIRALKRAGQALAPSRVPTKLVNAGHRYFGGWRNAVEAAGFDYDKERLVRAPYGRDELLDILRQLARRSPNMLLGDLHGHVAIDAWTREFGSVEHAARMAGLSDWPVRLLAPLMPKEETIAAIRERHRANQALGAWAVEQHDRRLYMSGLRNFGSWHQALVAARLPGPAIGEALGDRRFWTKTLVLEALRQRRRAGKSMSPGDLRRDDSGLFQAARIHLGYDVETSIRDWGATRKKARPPRPTI